MAELPAISSSPIAFSSQDGKYFLIPLNAVYFDINGVLKADRWPLYATYQAAIDPLMTELRRSGVLVAGPEPAQRPAIKATAKTVGSTGLLLKIEIANVVANTGTPPASTADVKVTETDTYTALAVDKVIETIGNAANGGTRPGLVFVSSAPPVDDLPKAGVYPMAAAVAGQPATADIPKHAGAGNAFTLQTRDGGADAPAVSIEIKDVNAGASTFTLVASWSKTQNAIAMTGLAAAFAYVIDVVAPAGGFRAPAEGVTTLGGGADAVAVAAVKASAIVLSK